MRTAPNLTRNVPDFASLGLDLVHYLAAKDLELNVLCVEVRVIIAVFVKDLLLKGVIEPCERASLCDFPEHLLL